MSTCRGCGTPNRPGRAICVACGERLASSEPPPGPGASPGLDGAHPGTLPGAGATANGPPDPENHHDPANLEIERTAAFDVADFRPPTLLGVGASEPPPPGARAPEPEPDALAPEPEPLPSTADPPDLRREGRAVPTTAPPDDVPSTEDAPEASPAPVVDSAPHPSRRRRFLTASGLVLAVAAAALAGAMLLRNGPPAAEPPDVHAHVSLDGPSLDGKAPAPASATLRVTAPAGSRVTFQGAPLSVEPAASPRAGEQVLVQRIDLSADARGEAPTAQLVERQLEIDVSFADGSQRRSKVSFQASVTPLTLTGPGPRWVVQPGLLVVSGKSQAGALVQAGSSRTRADAHGQFVLPVADVAPGTLSVTAQGEGGVLRTVDVAVLPSAKLPEPSPFGEIANGAGQRVRVDGTVVEVRARPAGTTVLLEVDRGCPSGGCRVSLLQPLQPAAAPAHSPGQRLTVVGDVTVTGSLPHLRAELVKTD